ncbi:MAG: hypothetical protein GVY30_10680 [Chloroflexi bacterium]|jgi:hypothetical protein|nr:hypothetical protein [Chloroflexota bacterium]
MTRKLYFNGINGSTGAYGLEPMMDEALSDRVLNTPPPDNLTALEERAKRDKLKYIRQQISDREKLREMTSDEDMIDELDKQIQKLRTEEQDLARLGVIESVDATKLEEAGWGIIFGTNNPHTAKIKEALQPLLDLRQAQAGEFFEIYEGGAGCRPDDTAGAFISRHGAQVGDPADPRKVPYYLLIVGDPTEIDYRFQYQLDVQYAVGRIDFGDDLDAYHNYARSVVQAAGGEMRLAPQATFFGAANADDQATQLSAGRLVRPLFEALTDKDAYAHWQMKAVLADEAKKAALAQVLGGDAAPALLFTASHGMVFDADDARQRPHQGALLCQDWPGPDQWRGDMPQDFYFAGDDLASNANLWGMIAFFFACFGGGTPRYDAFSRPDFQESRKTIAEQPFTAALPQAMLRLSKGGALAVIGHVDRAWGNSFLGDDKSQQTGVFQAAVESLLRGKPVGMAMEYFDMRYAALSTELTTELEEIEWGRTYDPNDLAMMWTSNNDARGYVIIGDPAVRLPVAGPSEDATGRVPLAEAVPPTITAPTPAAEEITKPDEILASDWEKTPESVKEYIQNLRS